MICLGNLSRQGEESASSGRALDDQAACTASRSVHRGLLPQLPGNWHRLLHAQGGTLEDAQRFAAHASPRTTKLYNRTSDRISLGEIERILI